MRAVTSAAVLFLAFMGPSNSLHDATGEITLQVDIPSVKLHVTLRRKSAQIYGQQEFDVFANPVVSEDGESVLYDGYMTFDDGDSKFTYLYVNGEGYLSTKEGEHENSQCISSSTLPFNVILPALNDATPIPSASIGDELIECPSGNLFKTSFSGTHFAICASGKFGFTAYSSDMTISGKLCCPFEAIAVVWCSGKSDFRDSDCFCIVDW